MAFKPPGNTVRLRVARFREFGGIGGPALQILQRRNDRGWDISNSVANEVYDLILSQPGTMQLREGCRKITNVGTAEDMNSLFFINIGRMKRYGVHHGGSVDVSEIPEWYEYAQEVLNFAPAQAVGAATNVYPSSDPGMPL